MRHWKKPDAAVFCAAALMLALAFRLLDHKTDVPSLSTLFCGAALLLDAGMLFVWLHSVRRRLLPSRARACIVASALLFLSFLVLSTVNYRVAGENDLLLKRVCWYLYYVTLLFVPSLFLSTCVSIARGKRAATLLGAVCIAVSGLLFTFVITNDWHYLVFVPQDPERFTPAKGYGYGPVFYIIVLFVSAQLLAGVFRLAVLFRKRAQLLLVLLPLAFLPCYLPFSRLIYRLFGAVFISMPMFSIFCMACFFELCIRMRLIPYNENYTAFFGNMQFPAVITDAALSPVFRTAAPVAATREQLRAALASPVYVTPDARLSGKPLKAGCVFYTEDESELNRMNERLLDANEMLLTEHTLIRAENELREQRASVESRSRIYAEIAEKTYACQQKVARLLSSAVPGAPEFNDMIAQVSLLNAYIKRSANLLLVNEGESEISGRELKLSLEESARCLTFLGVQMDVVGAPPETLARETAFLAYETFENILEAALPEMRRMHAAVSQTELRLVTDAALPAALPATALPVTVNCSEGLVYYTVPLKGGRVV